MVFRKKPDQKNEEDEEELRKETLIKKATVIG